MITSLVSHLLVADQKANLCSGAAAGGGAGCGTNLSGDIASVTQTLLVVAGAIAVIIIIFGGIMYITSTGDSARVKQAKDTILYAIIGLVVTIVAFAIVHFVSANIS